MPELSHLTPIRARAIRSRKAHPRQLESRQVESQLVQNWRRPVVRRVQTEGRLQIRRGLTDMENRRQENLPHQRSLVTSLPLARSESR